MTRGARIAAILLAPGALLIMAGLALEGSLATTLIECGGVLAVYAACVGFVAFCEVL